MKLDITQRTTGIQVSARTLSVELANGRGRPGSVWRFGSVPPDNSVGANGDNYFDDSSGKVYLRTGGVYVQSANMAGLRAILSRGSAVAYRPSFNFAGSLAAVDNSSASRTDVVVKVSTVAALAAAPGVYDRQHAHCECYSTPGKGGGGPFYWDAASTETADGVMIVAASGAATGRWKRTESLVTPYMFGAIGDDATDDTTALQAFATYVGANACKDVELAGKFKISSKLTWNGNATKHIHCDVTITALASFVSEAEMFQITNSQDVFFSGYFALVGSLSAAMSGRKVGTGIALNGFNGGKFEHMWLSGFKYYGIRALAGGANNNNMDLGQLRLVLCGPYELTGAGATSATWNTRVDSGTTGSTGQLSTITVTTLPSVDYYFSSIAIINGFPYIIKGRNAGASTIDVYPWIDTALTSGTISYVTGAAIDLYGGDCGMTTIRSASIQACGVSARFRSLYGANANCIVMEANLIGIVVGDGLGDATLDVQINRPYFENNVIDFIKVTIADTGSTRIISPTNLVLSKCFNASAPRFTDNSISATYGTLQGVSIHSEQSHEFSASQMPANYAYNIPLAIGSPALSQAETYGDAKTITLSSNADLNRLYGYSGVRVVCLGSGAGSRPTTSVTFVCSAADITAGYTVMSGSSYVFTAPSAPILVYAYLFAKNWLIMACPLSMPLTGSATYDPPSLVDGAGTTATVTVTGAALGDFAQASFSLDLQGITVTAWVSAANTVSVRLQNESGGTLDLASGTLRARVVKS